MMYKVIKSFIDLQDGNREYKVGDIFPHKNSKVFQSRINELASNKNKRGVPLIEEIPEKIEETKKKTKSAKAEKK